MRLKEEKIGITEFIIDRNFEKFEQNERNKHGHMFIK